MMHLRDIIYAKKKMPFIHNDIHSQDCAHALLNEFLKLRLFHFLKQRTIQIQTSQRCQRKLEKLNIFSLRNSEMPL